MAEILWFVSGVMTVLAVAAILFACFIFMKNRTLTRQVCDLMNEKGKLAMRISILENALREKEGE